MSLQKENEQLKQQFEEARKQLKICELTLQECVISDDVGVTTRQYFKDKQGEVVEINSFLNGMKMVIEQIDEPINQKSALQLREKLKQVRFTASYFASKKELN